MSLIATWFREGKLAVCRSDRSRLASGAFSPLIFAIHASMACAVSENPLWPTRQALAAPVERWTMSDAYNRPVRTLRRVGHWPHWPTVEV
jgi:hypothetical protein